jgi:hypothetical protein
VAKGSRRLTRGPHSPGSPARPATIRLGVLVSPVTFRIPGNLAKVIQTVDEISDGGRGRVRGWVNENEHEQLGIRFRRAASASTCSRKQMASSTASDRARWVVVRRDHWQVKGSSSTGRSLAAGDDTRTSSSCKAVHASRRSCPLRRRVQPQLRLSRRCTHAYARIRARLEELGAHPDEVVYSAMTGVLVGETQEDVRARVATCSPRSARRLGSGGVAGGPAATWIMARPTRRWNAFEPSRPPACSASCSRTSFRGSRPCAAHGTRLPG